MSEDWCGQGSNPWTPCHKTDVLPVNPTLRWLKKTVLKFPWEIIICPCKHFLPWRTEHISMADLFLIPTIKSGNCSATNPRTVLAATLPKCCVTMSRNLEQNETIGKGVWIREMWRLHNLKKKHGYMNDKVWFRYDLGQDRRPVCVTTQTSAWRLVRTKIESNKQGMFAITDINRNICL